MYVLTAAARFGWDVSARSPRMCRSSSPENARGRSTSMNFRIPRASFRARSSRKSRDTP